ncbi:SHOCT domain-containing protein [Haloferacaceae archaeon DSL9]
MVVSVDRLRDNATQVASLLVTGVWLAALFTGQGWWLAALLFGYIVVVPLVALLYGDENDRSEWIDGWTSQSDSDATSETKPIEERGDAADPLQVLRDRYARGELTDDQFERKLDRLLETETLEELEERRVRERLRER